MSKPLSREELEAQLDWFPDSWSVKPHSVLRTALHYLDRVVKLEKENQRLIDRLQEVEHPFDASEFKALEKERDELLSRWQDVPGDLVPTVSSEAWREAYIQRMLETKAERERADRAEAKSSSQSRRETTFYVIYGGHLTAHETRRKALLDSSDRWRIPPIQARHFIAKTFR